MNVNKHYDKIYSKENYFGYSERLYNPYIRSLIKKIGIKQGSLILDAPCGQGFFSYLFKLNGMNVKGIDISETGIAMANKYYGSLDINFSVADILKLSFNENIDCIFSRSCSLYSTIRFTKDVEITESLLRYLKPGGIFIFAYNTNLAKSTNNAWVNHSLEDVKEHFEKYKPLKLSFYFINKIDTFLLNKYAFNTIITKINTVLMKTVNFNGELICVFKKKSR